MPQPPNTYLHLTGTFELYDSFSLSCLHSLALFCPVLFFLPLCCCARFCLLSLFLRFELQPIRCENVLYAFSRKVRKSKYTHTLNMGTEHENMEARSSNSIRCIRNTKYYTKVPNSLCCNYTTYSIKIIFCGAEKEPYTYSQPNRSACRRSG